jgi:RNA polymerase sigma factor (sigma-70 family)
VGTGGIVERLRAGDRDAFAALYDEYGDAVYGLCMSLLRDHDEAADVKHDTFVVALQRIDQLRDPERLRPWMFAIARHLCFRRLKQRERAVPVERAPDTVVLDDDDDPVPESAAAVVWVAAGGLSDRDRAVLALNLVDGLEGADLAAALGASHANPHSLLSRAKARLERSVGVLLVATLGREDCATLAEFIPGWDGTLTPQLRKRLARHVDACSVCGHTRTRLRRMSVASSLALLAPAARAEALTAGELFEIASRRPVPSPRWRADGFPPNIDEPRRRRRAMLAAAGAGIIGAVVLFVVTAGSDATTRTPPLEPVQFSPRVESLPPTNPPATTVNTTARATTTTAARSKQTSPTTTRSEPAPTIAPAPSSIRAATQPTSAPPAPTPTSETTPHTTPHATPHTTPRPTPPTTVPPTTAPPPPTTSTTIRF